MAFQHFILLLLVIFLYTQFTTVKKQINVTNSEGEKIELTVEMADTYAKKARGLMFRKSLGEDEGMLFVFDKPGKYGFWMVNTSIPLDLIFIDENKTVVDIAQMEPCGIRNCPVYIPLAEALYVLEVNQGFSVSNKIEKGKSTLILE